MTDDALDPLVALLAQPFPDDLGALVDHYYEMRQLRLDMKREVDAVQERETEAKSAVLQRLAETHGTTGVSGARARAQRIERRVVSVTDWPAFYRYIREQDRMDLLQRRPSSKAIMDAWEADQDIPGCTPAISVDLSITKV